MIHFQGQWHFRSYWKVWVSISYTWIPCAIHLKNLNRNELDATPALMPFTCSLYISSQPDSHRSLRELRRSALGAYKGKQLESYLVGAEITFSQYLTWACAIQMYHLIIKCWAWKEMAPGELSLSAPSCYPQLGSVSWGHHRTEPELWAPRLLAS